MFNHDPYYTDELALNIAIVDPIFQFLAVFVVPLMTRRTLIILGGVLITSINVSIAAFDQLGENLIVLISVLSLVAMTSLIQEPVFSLYMTEVSNNSSLGLVNFVQFSLNSTISFALPFLVRNLGPSYLYYFFGGVSLVGTVAHFFIVKETAHLTDREKKALYSRGESNIVQESLGGSFSKRLIVGDEKPRKN